jgi:hypothetical protein
MTSRRLGVEGTFDTGEKKYACRLLVGKPEGKYPLGKPWRRNECTIEVDLKEIMGHGVDWIHVARYRDIRGAVVRKVSICNYTMTVKHVLC